MIKLSRFELSDIDELISWVQSEKEMILWAGTRFKWPLDRFQLDSYCNRRLANNIQYMIFKAIDTETNQMVGHVELSAIDLVNLSATVVHVLVKPDRRNTGVASQMLKQLVDFGFDYFKLHRIDLVVVDFNAPAIACYRRLGFKEEGIMRDTKKFGDQYWNMLLLSVLDYEWSGHQDANKNFCGLLKQ